MKWILLILLVFFNELGDVHIDSNDSGAFDKEEVVYLINRLRANGCDCGWKTMPPAAGIKWNDKLVIISFGPRQG